MYPVIQDVAKFHSICEKYKMDLYPELRVIFADGNHVFLIDSSTSTSCEWPVSSLKKLYYKLAKAAFGNNNW